MTPHIVWTSHCFYDVYKIIPLPSPVHGIIAMSQNAMFYIKEHGSALCQLVNVCSSDSGELEILKKEGNTPIVDSTSLELNLGRCTVDSHQCRSNICTNWSRFS